MEAVEIMALFQINQRMRHYYNMRKNYTHLIASYKKTNYEEGLAEGRDLGKAEGWSTGWFEGKAEGKAEVKAEVARRLLANGMPLEEVATVTGLSQEEVSRYRA